MNKKIFLVITLFFCFLITDVKAYNQEIQPILNFNNTFDFSVNENSDGYSNYERALAYAKNSSSKYYMIVYTPTWPSPLFDFNNTSFNQDKNTNHTYYLFMFDHPLEISFSFDSSTKKQFMFNLLLDRDYTIKYMSFSDNEDTSLKTMTKNPSFPYVQFFVKYSSKTLSNSIHLLLDTNSPFVFTDYVESSAWSAYKTLISDDGEKCITYNIDDMILNASGTYYEPSPYKYFDIIDTRVHKSFEIQYYGQGTSDFLVTTIEDGWKYRDEQNSFQLDSTNDLSSMNATLGYYQNKTFISTNFQSFHQVFNYFTDSSAIEYNKNDFYSSIKFDLTNFTNKNIKRIFVYYNVPNLYQSTTDLGGAELVPPTENPPTFGTTEEEEKKWYEYLNPLYWFEQLGKFIAYWVIPDFSAMFDEFHKLLDVVYEKLPILEDIFSFFDTLTSYQAPEIDENYNPLPKINVETPFFSLHNQQILDLSFYNQYRDYIFMFIKSITAVYVLIKILSKISRAVS